MENQKIEMLKRIQIFSSLTSEGLDSISGDIILKKFKKNKIILHEEDTNVFMYVIISGKVKVARTNEEGKEVILAMHQTGDFFGEMTLIDGKTIPASVVAIEDSDIMLISRKSFYSMVFSNRKVLEELMQILCSRLRESWDRIDILSFNNASQRIKMLFILLADKYGKKTDKGTTLNIKLTHQDLANMTGISRETVTRVIDKLQREKDITVLKDKFMYLSHNFLQKDIIL